MAKKSDSTPKEEGEKKPSTKKQVKLECPHCGFDRFNVRNGRLESCGDCGLNTTWAYTEKYVEAAKEYVRSQTNSRGYKAHKDTPECDKRVRVGDEFQSCGSKRWKHDGEKLLYCGDCGGNYEGKQPKNIDEVIKTLGPKDFNPIAAPVQRKLTEDGIRRVKKAESESKQVSIEEHTVRE